MLPRHNIYIQNIVVSSLKDESNRMLVDNLGKNMVLTTFGMNGEGNVIWYPSLYD